MKRLKRLVLIILLLNLIHFNSYSTIMGSDISWHCLGGDSFLIKIAVYNDCNGTTPGVIAMNFKCYQTGVTFTTKNFAQPSSVDVTPVCSSVPTRCDSTNSVFLYGISRYIYQAVVHLNVSGSCCNILMSFSNGTRSSTITTGAAGANFYTEALMDRCQNPCDFSPEFNTIPVKILCSYEDATIKQGLYDSNNINSGTNTDSYTYEWAQPMSAANTNISYNGSYSYTQPIYFLGYPSYYRDLPSGFHLDPQTGDIQFMPEIAEQTVMVLKVNEFRNGVKIAELRREMQVIILNCTKNNTKIITSPNLPRYPINYICSGSPYIMHFSTTDPDTNDSITLSWNNALPGATWITNNGKNKLPTATLTWTPDPHGFYTGQEITFTVTAKDNRCPMNTSITNYYTLRISRNITESQIIVADSGCGRYWFRAVPVIGNTPISYSWQGESFNFNPNGISLVYHEFRPGIYPYAMTMFASNCYHTYFDTLVTDTFITNTLPPDTSVCKGASISLSSIVTNNSGPIKMIWGSGNTVFTSDTTFTKTLMVTNDTLIWSAASDTTGCVSRDTVHISLHKPIGLDLGADKWICSYQQAQLKASFNIDSMEVKSIIWTDLKTNQVVGNSSILITADSSQYLCTLTDIFGCTDNDTILLGENPEVIASALGQVICYGDETDLTADSTGSGNFQYLWYDSSNLIGVGRNISIKPLATADYWLKVLETSNGVTCKDSTKVRVRVNPLPVIKINAINKQCLNGSVINLNNFVTVDGIYTAGGIWSSPSPGLIYDDKFLPNNAGVSNSPGWKVKYDYTDPTTGCFNKDSIYIMVYDFPKPSASIGLIEGGHTIWWFNDDSVCTGSYIGLLGFPLTPWGTWRGTGVEGSNPSWWFNPDASGIINGGTYDAIYHYTDNNQCENEDTIRLTVFSTPKVEAGNNLKLCEDASAVSLTGNPAGGVWTGKGVSGNKFYPDTATPGFHVLNYTCTNIICNGSDTVIFVVYPKPSKPVISFAPTDSFLECNLLNGSYNWCYTIDTFTAPTTINNNSNRIDPNLYCKNCYFNVIFSDSNGCVSNTSAFFYFAMNSIDKNNRLSRLVFYPNPAHNELFIENRDNESASFTMTDIFGKTLLEKKIIPGKSTMPIQTCKPGIYFIFMNRVIAGKLIIE